jgi:hypothetical protein
MVTDGLKPGYKALNYIGIIATAVAPVPAFRSARQTRREHDSTTLAGIKVYGLNDGNGA